MSKKSSLSVSLTHQETLAGIVYLALQLFVLPSLLSWGCALLGDPFSTAEVNFLYFLLDFLAMLLIFHDFLGKNLRQAVQHPAILCQAVILGLAAYYACAFCTGWIIDILAPGYSNYNDAAISAMSRGNSFLMLIGTVVLVPPYEECMFRGLIFRNLYGKNRVIAYAVSILLFTAIHILGYIGQYSPLELLLACLQYLPAGLCLAWSYAKADTIFAPILVHAAVNYFSMNALR